MIKLVCLLKKRDGMTTAEFREYYETQHKVIGRESMRHSERYMRRFLDPLDGQDEADQPYDVITEIWFKDRDALAKGLAFANRPEIRGPLTEDEDKLFDRASMRFYTVEEHEDEPIRG